MAEFVQDLVAFLATQGHGTAATDLYQDVMPDSPDACVAVLSTPGGPSDGQFGTDALKYERPRASIWIRAAREDVAAARTKAFAVYKDIGKIQAETVNGTFYNMLVVLQAPFHLKDDDQARPIFAFNVEAEKEVAA